MPHGIVANVPALHDCQAAWIALADSCRPRAALSAAPAMRWLSCACYEADRTSLFVKVRQEYDQS